MANTQFGPPVCQQTEAVKDAPLDNILNFRDVGKTINQILGEKCVAERRVFRSARPDDATFSDRKRLKDDFGIKTIMDLRTVTEHANQAKKREGDLKTPALIQSSPALAGPMQIPGMKYMEININGKGFERSLLYQLSAWSFMHDLSFFKMVGTNFPSKLVALMAIGRRTEAIGILGREVMQPRGLIGLGYDSIDHCGPEIAEALCAYANLDNYGILVHCTQGKDRTGLVIALILFLLSVPIAAISYDYVASEEELLPEKENRMKEISSIGLTEEFAGCPKDWIEKMKEYLDEKYGGVENYCEGIGFRSEEQEKLRQLLKA